MFRFLFRVFCVSVLLCVYFSSCIIVCFLFLYKFTDHRHLTETQLQLINTRWFKYDRDKLWLVYTQIVPVIFEPPCIISSYCFLGESTRSIFMGRIHYCFLKAKCVYRNSGIRHPLYWWKAKHMLNWNFFRRKRSPPNRRVIPYFSLWDREKARSIHRENGWPAKNS